MRFLPFSALLLALGLSLGAAHAQVTDRPYVDERYSRRTKIVRVELTEQYTMIDMQYGEPKRVQLFNPFSLSDYTIQIDPKSRLYRPGDTSRRYRFIKAEGIPVSPEKRSVLPGEVVNFRLYYERLDPGIEVFDLYEGRNTDPDQNEGGHEFWNFYGIYIKNPPSTRTESRVPPPPKKSIPKEEPKEVSSPQEPPLLDKVPQDTVAIAPQLVGLAGTVYDAQTRKPIPAQLSYVEQNDSMRVGTSSGKYRLGLSSSGRYAVGVSAKGYLSGSLAISPADSTGKTTLMHDFYLTPLAAGASITLEKIYFATSEYQLLPESFNELDALVGMLRENPSLKIRIEGHTDNLGDFDKNVELSRNRADAVRGYLIKKGIDGQRLEAKGYGPTRPVGKGDSEAERQKNRRVEFVVVQI